MSEIIAVVGFSTKKPRPIANKKFDEARKAAAYILEVLLREQTDFISVRKVRIEAPGNPTSRRAGATTHITREDTDTVQVHAGDSC